MNYVQKQAAIRQELLNVGARFGEQKALDLIAVALHRKGWGYQRVQELFDLVKTLDEYYAEAFRADMESDVYQERLDNELRDLAKDHKKIPPFRLRYPEVKMLGYDKMPKARKP